MINEIEVIVLNERATDCANLDLPDFFFLNVIQKL